MQRETNFRFFRKLPRKNKLKSITIDIDSIVISIEGHQERIVKGYNPKKPGKIIRTARSVMMKLSEKYPNQEMYEKSLS